jgi:hypothetical protein
LSFELSRSGFIQLNKAEAKLEETYVIEERLPSPKKNKTLKVQKESANATSDNTTDSSSSDE